MGVSVSFYWAWVVIYTLVSGMQASTTMARQCLNHLHLYNLLPPYKHLSFEETELHSFSLRHKPQSLTLPHRGYYKMTMIRIKHNLSNNDLLDPTPLSTTGPSYLKKPLPKRHGDRPKIRAHTMPQRQEPGPIDAPTRALLQSLVRQLAAQHPDLFEVRPSHTEGKTTDGLYAKKDVPSLNPIARDPILNHEIAHAHPADNSLHVWLSDPDARKVVEAGWGQRFPLTFVKSGWTMVYAPRDEVELAVVERIVKAGTAWITGVEI